MIFVLNQFCFERLNTNCNSRNLVSINILDKVNRVFICSQNYLTCGLRTNLATFDFDIAQNYSPPPNLCK